MSNLINDWVYTLEDKRFMVAVNTELYDKEAIVASAYKFSNRFYIYQNISEKYPKIIDVFFENKENSAITEADVKDFCNDLIDQQIRIHTTRQFGHIRDLIVEEAFKPVKK
jgi:His-Xaa-Ser system protein HxsD